MMRTDRRYEALVRIRRAAFVVSALLSTVLLMGSSCSWRTVNEPSVLVILVENLGFGAFSCGDGSEAGRARGFKTFCDEAVRFTHAYTPSLMSQATTASLLTAKYPYEHGVRHNGAQSLSARELTVAEAALEGGFRTAFFSGGAPILRRSGLNQGFELFDDNITFGLKTLYRSAPETARVFLNWRDAEAARRKLFAFLYFPDLQMTDVATTNELGELRESSYRSQLDAVDEALSILAREMKRRKIWDSTHIFLVGLQSVGPERTGEISATNLYSEGTRTTLMVKPARKVRDGPFNWKIDTNVSLADLGATLFDLIGMSRPSASQTAFPIFSLKSALVGPEPDWPSHRMILLETGWPQWRHRGGIRAAVRKGSNFFLFDEEPLLFDTLTDIGELNPQRVGFFLGGPRAEIATFSEKLRSIGFQPWKELESVAEERAVLAHELWGESWGEQTSFTEVQQRLIETAKKHPEDQVLQSWRAIWAIRNSDWSELKSAASVARQPLWSYIAARNLGEKVAIPANEPCLSFLTDMATLSKDCRVEGWQDFLTWANESLSESVRTKAGDNFFRTYFGSKLATRVAEHNQFVGMICDSSEKLDKPGIFDLLLALPELKRQRALVRARLGAELGRHQTYRD